MNIKYWDIHRYDEQGKDVLKFFADVDDVSMAGWLVLKFYDDMDPSIASVNVVPDFQKKGIGTQLLHNAISVARKRNCREVHLFVKKTNDSAKRLYEKLGFQYGANDDKPDIKMFLELK